MNPRQRRGVILLIVTFLGALATFAVVVAYVNSISSQVGPMADVVKLKRTVPSLSKLSAEDVEVVQVPERWLPTSSLNSVEELAGKVTAGELTEGSYLQHGMLMQAPGLEPGYREVAIMVNAETGVAGKVSSGDRVDILATIEDPNTKVRDARVVVQNALVIDVGVVTTTGEDSKNGGFQETEGVPVTFALSTEDSLKLAFAESFAVKVRLALREVGDDGQIPAEEQKWTSDSPAPEGGQ